MGEEALRRWYDDRETEHRFIFANLNATPNFDVWNGTLCKLKKESPAWFGITSAGLATCEGGLEAQRYTASNLTLYGECLVDRQDRIRPRPASKPLLISNNCAVFTLG